MFPANMSLSTRPLYLFCLALTAACPFLQPHPPLVNLNYTTYQGLRLPNGVNAFLGMRYAAPPLGDRRWRAPAEPLPTKGVVLATEVCHLLLLAPKHRRGEEGVEGNAAC